MFFILALLLFPCAVVGAFVTADERDLTAFQTSGSLLYTERADGAFGARSRAVHKGVQSSRAQGVERSPTNEARAPARVTMLVAGSTTSAGHSAFGSSPSEETTRASSPCTIIWPAALNPGVALSTSSLRDSDSAGPPRRRRRRSSPTALQAMSIPARCALPSVDLLREAYGRRRNFWGDLTPAETRRFYHELLPVSVRLGALGASTASKVDAEGRPLQMEGSVGGGLAAVVDAFAEEWEYMFGAAETLEEKARLASMARHAAKLYVRERCQLPVRVVAHLYDGLRHLKTHGSFRVTGMTFEELWEKYERQILQENPGLDGEDLKTRVSIRILEKSCSISSVFNDMTGCSDLNAVPTPVVQAPTETPPAEDSSVSTCRGDSVAEAYAVEPPEAPGIVPFGLTRLAHPFQSERQDGQDKKDKKRGRRRERRPSARSRLAHSTKRPRATV